MLGIGPREMDCSLLAAFSELDGGNSFGTASGYTGPGSVDFRMRLLCPLANLQNLTITMGTVLQLLKRQ